MTIFSYLMNIYAMGREAHGIVFVQVLYYSNSSDSENYQLDLQFLQSSLIDQTNLAYTIWCSPIDLYLSLTSACLIGVRIHINRSREYIVRYLFVMANHWCEKINSQRWFWNVSTTCMALRPCSGDDVTFDLETHTQVALASHYASMVSHSFTAGKHLQNMSARQLLFVVTPGACFSVPSAIENIARRRFRAIQLDGDFSCRTNVKLQKLPIDIFCHRPVVTAGVAQ